MTVIKYQNREVEVLEVEVLGSNEQRWNEYQLALADGKVLLIKTVLMSVFRVLHEKAPDGQPLYITQTSQVVRVKEEDK